MWSSPSHIAIALLVGAACLDFAIGDPWGWPHPVQAMGKVISLYSQWAIKQSYGALAMRLLGIGLTVLLVGGTAVASSLVLVLLAKISLWLQAIVEVVLLASCFAGRSLRRAAEDVLQPLSKVVPEMIQLNQDRSHQGQSRQDTHQEVSERADMEPLMEAPLIEARRRLAMVVGRDTASLSSAEIRRAVLETVSENAIDGVLAPLFYAVVGSLFGAAVPVALAYKAASTLDSMVGYKASPYTHLGWFSARFEDALTWLPCRLSVLTVAILSGRPVQVLRVCQRDAIADPSPNAGWSECAYAAALGVQLGGLNTYRGQVKMKPLLGDNNRPITTAVITQALQLTRWSFLIGLSVGILLIELRFSHRFM
ncbi:MAG: adenosylcobinamide-phosphate synthase CbiB [Phormidesmis sp.]